MRLNRSGFSLIEVLMSLMALAVLWSVLGSSTSGVRRGFNRGEEIVGMADRLALLAARVQSDVAALEADPDDPASVISAGNGYLTLTKREDGVLSYVEYRLDPASGNLIRTTDQGFTMHGQGGVGAFRAMAEVDVDDGKGSGDRTAFRRRAAAHPAASVSDSRFNCARPPGPTARRHRGG